MICVSLKNIHLLILWYIFDYKMKNNFKFRFLFLLYVGSAKASIEK